jgi:hypothetical protein
MPADRLSPRARDVLAPGVPRADLETFLAAVLALLSAMLALLWAADV